MQTRSSSRLTRDQTSFQQKVENSNLEEHLPPIVTMADNRTMAEMLRAACRWLEKEPMRSITTWDDLASKFINEFFPPSRTTNLRNEISNFHQKFDESFHEAWERYKDLLRACPYHGFTELHQLDTFYNALNPADQDSLNAAAGGNLLEKSPQDALTIIKNKSKVRGNLLEKSPQDALTIIENKSKVPMLKQLQATPPPAPVKAVEEIYVTCGGAHPYYQCLTTGGNTFLEFRDNIQAPVKAVEEIYVTCGGAHPYYQCLTTGGNTFLEFRDNIQGYVSAAASNYNQGNPGYRSQGVANRMRPPGFAQPNVQNNQN
nr:hypothetical protein [Tanacetum cinerariifolium]